MSHPQLRALMQAAYGSAPAESELEWWLDRNPAGAHVSLEEHGADGVYLARVAAEGKERLAAFVVHAVTSPHARGRGIFSRLQRANEEWAAERGAALALGFTTDAATRVLTDKLGWELIARPRVWARLRLPRRGRLRGPEIEAFEARHQTVDLAGPAHLLKDVDWLDWRYRDSPRPYRLVETSRGWAVVGIGRHGGLVAGAVCELRGGLGTLRRAVRACSTRAVFALPNAGEERLYAAAGFFPTPWRLHFVGRSLDGSVPLPRGWRLSLGDTDFF